MPVRVGALVALFLAIAFDTGALGNELRLPLRDSSGPSLVRSRSVRRRVGLAALRDLHAKAKLLDFVFPAIFAVSPHVALKVTGGTVHGSLGQQSEGAAQADFILPVPTLRDVDLKISAPGIDRAHLQGAIIERARHYNIDAIGRPKKHHPVVANGQGGEQHIQVLLPWGKGCVQLDISQYPSAEAMNAVKSWTDWRYLKLGLDRSQTFHKEIEKLTRVDSEQSARKLVPNLEHPEYVSSVLHGWPRLTPEGIDPTRYGEAPLLFLYLAGKHGYRDVPLWHFEHELKRVGIIGKGQTAMMQRFLGPQVPAEDANAAPVSEDLLRRRRTAYLFSSFRVRGASSPRLMDRVLDGASLLRVLDVLPGMREVASDARAWDRTKQVVQAVYAEAYQSWQHRVKDEPCGIAHCSDGRDFVFGSMLSELESESKVLDALAHIAGGIPQYLNGDLLAHQFSLAGVMQGWEAGRKWLTGRDSVSRSLAAAAN